MDLPAPALMVGVFLAGILVGFAIRAFISARRARRYQRRHDLEWPQRKTLSAAFLLGTPSGCESIRRLVEIGLQSNRKSEL